MKALHNFGNIYEEQTQKEYREYCRMVASIAAMQGLLANGGRIIDSTGAELIAIGAVQYADSLLNQLNKEPE